MKSIFVIWLGTFSSFALAGEANTSPVDFVHDVAPILSRLGCNGSSCHGKAEGQNGFKLSVFGNDPEADYAALVIEGRGRRVMPTAAAASLVLQKATASLPHEGGPQMKTGSRQYELLQKWIVAGAPYASADRSELTELRIEPARKVVTFGAKEPLKVLAKYADGSEDDVTWLSVFHSNNAGMAEVTEDGLVTIGNATGQTAVMARFLGKVAVFQALIPQPGDAGEYPQRPVLNVIDDLVDQNLKRLNVHPSEMADDAEFFRRVYLDVIGRLPTADESRKFLADASPKKRAELVDWLLEQPEFVDFWALKWSDLLRVDRLALGHRDALAYYQWIRDSVAENKPFDQFARELLLAGGPLSEQPAGHFYQVAKKSGDRAATTAQVFLGVRIACAECHQHPYDQWTQRDYHGMRAFFEPVKPKTIGTDTALLTNGAAQVKHPRSGDPIYPYALGTAMPESAPEGDPRIALADWMTQPDNPWFARNLANRFWSHFLGRGLVEPIDDFRATNPPSNPELLDALAKHLVENQFDVKALIRFIAASRTYQLSSKPNATNENDEQNFARALFKRLPAEVLVDSVCDVTGVPEKFTGVPSGYRAVQLWDSQAQHYFLKLFGRPARATPCECERSTGASIAQALHLMNSPVIQEKLSHTGGAIGQLVSEFDDDQELVTELYLSCFNRFPSADEESNALQYLGPKSADRRRAVEDLAWSMMNSLEFVFNH